jgi:hypothetical protein
VLVPSSEAAAVKVQWFFNDQQIGVSFPAVIEVSEPEVVMGSTVITSTLVLQGETFTEDHSGYYDCQIVVTDTGYTDSSYALFLGSRHDFRFELPCSDQELFSDSIDCVLLFPHATTTAASISAATSRAATNVFTTLGATALPDNSSPQPVWVYVVTILAILFGATTMLLCGGLCFFYYRRKTGRKYRV